MKPINREGGSSVYVLWAEGTHRFKIGFTRGSVDDRALTISMTSPLNLRIVAETPGDRTLEQRLHRELQRYRLHGEWFELPEPAAWWLFGQCGVTADMVRARIES